MTLEIANISVTLKAAPVLREHRATFKPRRPGDMFALVYMSSFVEGDCITVAGFNPGYTRYSLSPEDLGGVWALARPVEGPEFYFMPRFRWRAEAWYLIDLVSERYELFSIGPAGG